MFVLKRVAFSLGQVLVVLWVVTLLAFFLMEAVPGDTIDLLAPPGATDDEIRAISQSLGLDRGVLVRYFDWLGDALSFDFGRSISTKQLVSEAVIDRYPVSLEIAAGALAISLLIAVPLGVYCGYRPGGLVDRVVGVVTSAAIAIPTFLLGPVLLYIFAVQLQVLPLTGYQPWSAGAGEHLRFMVLPIMTLAAGETVLLLRVLRADMVATLREDFVVSARTRGLSTARILFGHALRPSSFSMITVLGVSMGRMIGGSVVVESIFRLPGLGQLAITSISSRDFQMVQAVILIAGVTFVLVNGLVNASYALLDPRLRSSS